MKKTLLFGASILCAATQGFALEPLQLDNFQGIVISADGKYLASDLYGVLQVYNLETGEFLTFEGDGWEINYAVGMGNAITADGNVLVGESPEGGASYLKAGEWTGLSVPNPQFSNRADGITPDGLRICGCIGMQSISIDEKESPMLVPVYWELGEDGEYGEPVMLPYPEHDFTGRVPQYVTAMNISANGKLIVGQVVDWSGFMPSLICYTQDDEGKWSYTLSSSDLLNPNHVEFPVFPGDGPTMPSLEDFMSDSEKAAYDEACVEWENTCSETENWDWSTYPDVMDYISAENLAIYNAAKDEYEKQYAEWSEKYEAFEVPFNDCVDNGKPLTFNNLFLNPEGTMAVSSYSMQDENADSDGWGMPQRLNAPITFNLSDNTYKTYSVADNSMPSGIAEGGVILATRSTSLSREAVVYTPDAEAPVSLIDYMTKVNPATAEYMKQNMYHDLQSFDPDTYELITVDNVDCTGIPFCTPSQSVFVSRIENLWDLDNYDLYAFSYILPGTDTGVKCLGSMSDRISIRDCKAGVITLEGDVKEVSVIDMDGRVVYSGVPVGGKVETGLAPGTYVVKAVGASGVKTSKLVNK